MSLTKTDVELILQIIKNSNLDPNKLDYKDVVRVIYEYTEIMSELNQDVTANKRSKWYFLKFVRYLLDRALANYDNMLLVSGLKGTGKSSTSIQIGRAWCKMLGKNFNPKKNIAYDNADVIRLIEQAEKFDVIIADEALRFISSEDWNKSENKELKKIIGQVRTKHLLFIMNFPMKISKVDKTYLESYVDYWMLIYKRQKAAIFIKDLNATKDVWNLKAFDKLGSWNEFTYEKVLLKKLEKHPNFWMDIRIPKVPKSSYLSYLKVREKNVYSKDVVASSLTKDDFFRAVLLLTLRDIIERDGTLSINRVTKAIDRIYGIHITKPQLATLIEDAEKLMSRKEEIKRLFK